MFRRYAVLFAILTLPLVRDVVLASTSYVGQITQKVDGSATTQPVSGTVTVTQGTASSLKVDLSGTAANATAIKVDNSAVTQPVSGTVTVQQATASSLKVDLSGTAANGTAIKVDGSAVSQPVTFSASSAPTIAKVGATTTSASLIAANATRKGIEIDTDCANTDAVAINFGASAAVYANHKQIPACVNWQPPPGVVVTSAIQVISNSGTQNVRVIEYP